ncbi:hypothetical protein B0A55_02111 [Friedmanniomyces simplex]|uniref:aspartate kinase n=1 Tax=Friedmanniomyces simplex TaxID=329884 RepID=A0A4U0XU02_9PEZI|nr:hypothetical protein B0A55_02111 [Friedmanniomyces simplex]
MAIISLVGRQLRSMVGISGRFFSTLGEHGVNIDMISQGASEINISCVIEEREANRALNVRANSEKFVVADESGAVPVATESGREGAPLTSWLISHVQESFSWHACYLWSHISDTIDSTVTQTSHLPNKAFPGSHPRQSSNMTQHNHSHSPDYRREDSHSTAYTGSQGQIDDNDHRNFTPVDLDSDGFDLQLPSTPSKAAILSTRPAFGARFLSTISNAQPAAAALTRKGSVLHSRAKSLAGFVPKLSASSTTSTPTTPEKVPAQQQRHPVFGDLFNGESAPVRIGIPQSPTKEETEDFVMEYKPAFTQRPAGGPRRRSSAQTNNTNAATPPPTTKPSWFSRKLTTAPTSPPAPQRPQDPLLTPQLIPTSLFPTGSPPASPSPHAFNDLLLNATNLLERLQAAYREKASALAAVRPELEAQREEVEEAETRAEHLRWQLEEMGRRAEETEGVVRGLLAGEGEKEKEKGRGVEVGEEAARNSVKMVRRSMDRDGEEEGEEDATPRRRKRGSAGSGSDSGFESEGTEYAESILSGSGAGGGGETPLMTLTPADEGGRDWALSGRPGLSRQSTMSVSNSSASGMAYNNGAVRSGGDGAAAAASSWASAEHLRAENARLRRQVEEMQGALQGCIDFVGSGRA